MSSPRENLLTEPVEHAAPQMIVTQVRRLSANTDPLPPAVQQPDSILAIIAQAARDPQVDVAKMQALLEMKERLDDRDAEREFNRDFALAMREMPRVAKRGIKDMGTKGTIPYETYEDLDAAIRPIESKYGFARSFSTRISDKGTGVILVLTLTHRAGHSITSERYCPPDPGPGRNDTQAIGSGESYGRRYLTKSRWNIVTVGEDDDAKTAENLTDDQYGKLVNLVEACAMDGEETNRFLKYVGVGKVADIRPGDYDRATEALRKKLRQKQGGAR